MGGRNGGSAQMNNGGKRLHETSPMASSASLHGKRLVVARALVISTMALATGLFGFALPVSFVSLATPCADELNQCLMTPEQVTPLADFGVSPHTLAFLTVALSCLVVLLVYGVAAVLIWRRSDDWMALLLALVCTVMPVNLAPVLATLRARPTVLQLPTAALSVASTVSLFLLVTLFPSGRFAPRWLWLPLLLTPLFFSPVGDPLGDRSVFVPDLVFILFALGLLLCFAGAQIYRFRRVSTLSQRQQTKWVVFGLVLLIVVNRLFWQPYLLIPALQRPDSLYSLLAYPDDFLALAILVTTLGVSILRYRLYDIDRIINKALVYGALTAILKIIFFSGGISLETAARSATGLDSPVALVASTVLIAILFQPLRSRIQKTIDRRFYRARYDAQKTLSIFSATLRQDISLH
jgi:hypothetical protein